MISPNGKMRAIIMIFGQSRTKNGVSLLDGILRDLVEIERRADNREAQTTMLIIDSKSVQNADTAHTKGYDAGKKNRNQTAYRG